LSRQRPEGEAFYSAYRVDVAAGRVADANAARGWDRYVMVKQPDGSERRMSYEVIDSLEDAMKAIAPQDSEAHRGLDRIPPRSISRRRSRSSQWRAWPASAGAYEVVGQAENGAAERRSRIASGFSRAPAGGSGW
jgi:hypothetical protein